MFGPLHQAYGLCLQTLRSRQRGWLAGTRADGRPRRTGRFLLAALALSVAVLCIPVRQFVVAPAEIISLDAVAVTSPVEGIVAELVAKPNQAVKKGDVLIRLDDTAIRNRLDSARQALEVARAEYLAGAHRAFVSSDKTSETGVLRGRISKQRAEGAFLQEQLGMQNSRALRDGIAGQPDRSHRLWLHGCADAAGQLLAPRWIYLYLTPLNQFINRGQIPISGQIGSGQLQHLAAGANLEAGQARAADGVDTAQVQSAHAP